MTYYLSVRGNAKMKYLTELPGVSVDEDVVQGDDQMAMYHVRFDTISVGVYHFVTADDGMISELSVTGESNDEVLAVIAGYLERIGGRLFDGISRITGQLPSKYASYDKFIKTRLVVPGVNG